MLNSCKTVAIFADVQNIYYTVREHFGCHFDYNRFWKQVTHNRQVLVANAYAINKGDRKQEQFQNILKSIGFNVKLKPFIQRSDGSAKGDWDVGITLDIVEAAEQADVIVLASGDGDFDILVDKIQESFGVCVDVYGVERLTADSLIHAATNFYPISDSLLLRTSVSGKN